MAWHIVLCIFSSSDLRSSFINMSPKLLISWVVWKITPTLLMGGSPSISSGVSTTYALPSGRCPRMPITSGCSFSPNITT